MKEETLSLGAQFETPHPYPLGTRVRFRHPLKRRKRRELEGQGREMRKIWEPEKSDEWREGVVVGFRTLADGNLIFDEWGNLFVPTHHFRAYLIAFDLHRSPVYSRPEDVLPEIVRG